MSLLEGSPHLIEVQGAFLLCHWNLHEVRVVLQEVMQVLLSLFLVHLVDTTDSQQEKHV